MNSLVRIFLGIFQEGGWVLWPIFGVSIIGWYIGFGKLFFFRKIRRARSTFVNALAGTRTGKGAAVIHTGLASYDELFSGINSFSGPEMSRHEHLFREFLSDLMPDLEQGFSTMSACVSIAPLMGLLGTISGMNRMFAVITDVGLGSPGLMAGGISVALGSALAGLAVAVTIMFFHNFLYNKKTACIQALMKDGENLIRWASERLN